MTILSERLLIMTALSAAVSVAVSPARADDASPEQIAARRQLIEQAQAASGQGDHDRALDLATRAGELSMSTSLRRFIAEEALAAGQPATALGSAELCVREARGAASPDHVAACEAIVEKTKGEVAYLVISVTPTPLAKLRVSVSGKDVPTALLGQRYVVNPGTLSVDASGEGYLPAHRSVVAVKGAETPVTIALAPAPRPKVVPKVEPSFEISPLVFIGGGVAVTGGAVAAGLGISGMLALSDYEGRCTVAGAPASCAAEQTDLQSDLDGRAIGFDVAIGVAAAGLVVGTIGLIMSGTPDTAAAAAAWQGKVLF